jgi:hypothetical protein
MMRLARCAAALSVLALLSACDSGSSGDGGGHSACPGACASAVFATFYLSCNPSDLVRVDATGPCANPDASLSWYTGTPATGSVSVQSSAPGVCHITLVFATGFTYSRDVTFTQQTLDGPPGCPACPSFIGPTSGPFAVQNPGDTCGDAGVYADAGDASDASGDADGE